MAEISRRRTGELLRTLFGVLIDEGGVKASVALARTAERVALTPFEQGSYASGGRRFEKIVRFATVDCVKAGWLQKEGGTWTVTEVGTKAFEEFSDPERFYREACRLYQEWRSSRASAAVPAEAAPTLDAPESAVSVRVTFEEAEEQAWEEIEAFLRTSDPFEFQDLIADLLRGMGYFVAWVSPPGKDGGVDIIAYTDPLGAVGPRIKVQVKRWQSKVDSEGLRSFLASVNPGDVGIFMCLAGFTRDAADHARNQESRRVTLLDARSFVQLWVAHFAKLSDRARQRLPLRPIYFLAPQD